MVERHVVWLLELLHTTIPPASEVPEPALLGARCTVLIQAMPGETKPHACWSRENNIRTLALAWLKVPWPFIESWGGCISSRKLVPSSILSWPARMASVPSSSTRFRRITILKTTGLYLPHLDLLAGRVRGVEQSLSAVSRPRRPLFY